MGRPNYSVSFVAVAGILCAGWRSFSVAAPSVWNSLADYLCDVALGLTVLGFN